jgi:hypothetical protein
MSGGEFGSIRCDVGIARGEFGSIHFDVDIARRVVGSRDIDDSSCAEEFGCAG